MARLLRIAVPLSTLLLPAAAGGANSANLPNFDVAPPGVVLPVSCDDIQCAPFFVCVTRPVTCLSTVCPALSTVPLCIPGDSAACSRLSCSPSQKCIYQETSCTQGSCTPVAVCVARTSGPNPPSVRPPSTQPTAAPTTTTTTTRATTTTTPTTTTTRATTTTTTTRRTTTTTQRPTTTTTPRYTWKPIIPGMIPGIRINPPGSGYPLPPPTYPTAPNFRPIAPISIPSPGLPTNPGTSSTGGYPLPPPGVPGTQLQPLPPPVQPLPSGVHRPAPPPTITRVLPRTGQWPGHPFPSSIRKIGVGRPSGGRTTVAPGTTTMATFGGGNACVGVRCFVGFACYVDNTNTARCAPPGIAQQLGGQQMTNSNKNTVIGSIEKSVYLFPTKPQPMPQSESRRWPVRLLSESGNRNNPGNSYSSSYTGKLSSYATGGATVPISNSPALKYQPNYEGRRTWPVRLLEMSGNGNIDTYPTPPSAGQAPSSYAISGSSSQKSFPVASMEQRKWPVRLLAESYKGR